MIMKLPWILEDLFFGFVKSRSRYNYFCAMRGAQYAVRFARALVNETFKWKLLVLACG
jgi:hypothetical protein